ncbi:MAG: hypothetical protein WC553_02740 [Patescibacteria group bacterium]|jgi:hypothetical protein
MAEDRKDNLLNQRLAHFNQEVERLLLDKKMSRAKADRIREVLDEMRKDITERDRYRDEGSEDLAQAPDNRINRNQQYVEEQLQSEEQEDGEGDQGGEDGQGQSMDDGTDEGGQPQLDDSRKGRDSQRGDSSRREPGKEDLDRLNRKQPDRPSAKSNKSTGKPAPKPAVKAPVPAGGTAGAGAGAGAKAAGGKKLVMVVARSPYFWIALAIIVVIIIIVAWFSGMGHKSFNEGGGSIPIPMSFQDKEHVSLAGQVTALKDSGILVFASGTEGDVQWIEQGGDETMNLDWRIMETLKYLGNKWQERSNGIIEISVSYSNGPAVTRRKGVLKTFGVVVGGNGEEPLDAPSAYLTGQAIGISAIGRVSNELAKACFNDSDGDSSNNAPVQVKWQEIVSQDIIRPIYEQLQVDATVVYQGSKVLAGLARQSSGDSAYKQKMEELLQGEDEDAWYTKVGNGLDYMIGNLNKVSSLGGEGIDPRTKEYAQRATTALTAVRETTKTDVLAWENTEVKQQLEDGLDSTFRMMQVANMVGWEGSTKSSCRLWKAYEARQNIRQLVLDMEQMPADPALVPENKDWNDDLMVRQVIVYSPEDDLDNGWPEYDVFPKGAMAVDAGGVGFDDTGKNGVINLADSHFSDLPVDGGVFSKASTIFVYKAKGAWDLFQSVSSEVSLDVATGGASEVLDNMHDVFSGTGISTLSGEDLKKVTYKNFVHIGF